MLLKMSISGSILIILITILRFFAINKLPKKVFVLLWNTAILRLMIPFDLPIHYGIASPMVKIVDNSVRHYNVTDSPLIVETLKESTTDTAKLSLGNVRWTMFVWVAGMVVLLVVFGVLYWREYRKIRTALPVSEEIDDYFRSVITVPHYVKLLISDRIFTPLTFGVWSPKIVFPKILEPLEDMDIKYVLTHEVIHVRRFDNLWKMIILIAISIHWFNPLVWMMYIFFNRDIELSCDEKVIALLGETSKREYIMALVNLAQKQQQWLNFFNGFGKNAIHERIIALVKFKRATYINIGCAVFLLAGGITVFAQNDSRVISNEINMSAGFRSMDDSKKEEIIDTGYLQHGIKIVDGAYYYQGERVRIFMDLRENKSFENFSFDNEGTIDLRLIRSKNYSIDKIEYLTEEEANELLSDFDDYNLDEQTKSRHIGKSSRIENKGGF